MAKRDIFSTANKAAGKIPDQYDMTGEDIINICCSFPPADAVITAFRAGFVLGARAQKAGRFKEARRPAADPAEGMKEAIS